MSPRGNKTDWMLEPPQLRPEDKPLRWSRDPKAPEQWTDWDLRDRDEVPKAFVVMILVAALLMVAGFMIARGFLG